MSIIKYVDAVCYLKNSFIIMLKHTNLPSKIKMMVYIIIIEIKSLYTAAKTQGHAWNDVENGLAVKNTLILWMRVLTISSVWI